MKKSPIILMALAPLTLHAQELKNFNSVQEALLSGQSIAVKTDLDKCSSKKYLVSLG